MTNLRVTPILRVQQTVSRSDLVNCRGSVFTKHRQTLHLKCQPGKELTEDLSINSIQSNTNNVMQH